MSELAELGEIISKIELEGTTIDEAIVKTERNLKLLRTARQMLGQKNGAPKPRTKKAKTTT